MYNSRRHSDDISCVELFTCVGGNTVAVGSVISWVKVLPASSRNRVASEAEHMSFSRKSAKLG